MTEDTITIKKDTLWKYSTFVLIAVVVIGGFFVLRGGTGTAVDTGSNNQEAVNLNAFVSNPSLYPSLGPADAKNIVIEFADFQCPYCALAAGLADWTSSYKSQYGNLIGSTKYAEDAAAQGELRFIYVPWAFLGQESVYATEAALCANEQGKFWEMHDAIFKASDGPSENTGKYNKDKLEILAQSISGLDTSAFNSCLENDKYSSAIQQISSDVKAAGVTGTPAVFVNGQKVSPTTDAIQAALQ